eukprot:4202393-Prymnesium_polylepis.1
MAKAAPVAASTSPRWLTRNLPAADPWLSGGQPLHREGNRTVHDLTWAEYIEKEKRKQPKVVPVPPGEMRSTPGNEGIALLLQAPPRS